MDTFVGLFDPDDENVETLPDCLPPEVRTTRKQLISSSYWFMEMSLFYTNCTDLSIPTVRVMV